VARIPHLKVLIYEEGGVAMNVHGSVAAAIGEALGADAGREVDAAVERSALASLLFSYRSVLGLPQREVAARMGCSTSKVSKMEGADDDALQWGDVLSFFHAMGVDVRLHTDKQDFSTDVRLRQHLLEVHRLLEALTGILAARDGTDAMRNRIATFIGEVLFPLLVTVDEVLPRMRASISAPAPHLEAAEGGITQARAAEPGATYG
jgi:hypothetical protein